MKRNERGEPIRFKSRAVVGGNYQIKAVDYDEVHTPVIDFSLVRLCLALALTYNWKNRHVDVKSAFLNSVLDQDVYVTHPENLPKALRKTDLYQLLKALYGLHQSPLLWYRTLQKALKQIGFVPISVESAAMVLRSKKERRERMCIVLIYVDDLLFFSDSDYLLNAVVKSFLSKFEGTDLGKVIWYLGVAIKFTHDRCVLSQTAYIENLAVEHGLENCNSVHTPMTANFFDEVDANRLQDTIPNEEYRSIIGGILFAATRTRPEVALPVGILSQFASKPTKFLLRAARRVLAYLYTTRNYGLVYERQTNGAGLLTVYCDADHAGDKSDRKSRSGYIATLDDAPVSWWSKKQISTALSTAESEYMAMSIACQDLKCLRNVLSAMNIPQTNPTTVKVDNRASIDWAKADIIPSRAKHIDYRYHYIRECIKDRHVDLQHVPSSENIADGMTKPLPKELFSSFRYEFGVRIY